jgi:hypothetical protein
MQLYRYFVSQSSDLCVASQRAFIFVVYFVIDSVRKLLNTHSYLCVTCLPGNTHTISARGVQTAALNFIYWVTAINTQLHTHTHTRLPFSNLFLRFPRCVILKITCVYLGIYFSLSLPYLFDDAFQLHRLYSVELVFDCEWLEKMWKELVMIYFNVSAFGVLSVWWESPQCNF